MNMDERVSRLVSGEEPSFSPLLEVTPTELAVALSWYAQHKDKEEAEKWLTQYCKTNRLSVSHKQIARQVATCGYVARMISRGAIFPEKTRRWFEEKIQGMINGSEKSSPSIMLEKAPEIPKKNIQQNMAEQVSRAIGEIDQAVDEFIESDFSESRSPMEILLAHHLKGPQAPRIIEAYKRQRDEVRIALERTDTFISESYTKYTRQQLKKLEAYFDQIVNDAVQLVQASVAQRSPRKQKAKSPEKIVSKLKYCEAFPDLKVASVLPEGIIGAQGLWVYNTKTRKLGYYVADDASGLSLKGQTLLNYTESKSVCKKLRKPEVTLPQVLGGGKVQLRNLLGSIRAVEGPLSGRINKDTILLRIIKS